MKRLQAVDAAWSFTEKTGEISSPKTDQTPIELNHMKKFLITAAIVLSCAVTVPRASAQTIQLIWGGVPAGPVSVGTPFTVSLNLNFVPGGPIMNNLNGFSLWLANIGGAGMTLTDRQIGASIFNDLQTSNFNLFGGAMGGGIPEILDPINRQGFAPPNNQVNTDLGALSGPPQLTGNYFLMNLTFVATSPGVSTIGSTTSSTPNVGGRISVVNNSNGDTVNIPSSLFTVTVVPEPSSIALLCVGLMSAGVVAYRRRTAAR
jgi:hypothetical protein